jgi:7,8-dihydro-6-hydroxymethylpterin dimethyltransferase
VHGPNADWGQLSCGCHPNCGIGMAVMIDKTTKEFRPVTAFLNAEQLAKDIASVNDGARGKFLSAVGAALSLLRNYNPMAAPSTFKLTDLLQKFDKCFGATGRNYGKVTGDRTIADIEKRRQDNWNFLFIAGMWFQDLFNYDFRRTEQCIIPYATQEGEISFCAYNTGVGWRNIVEKMHMTATLTKWYEEHSLKLNAEAVAAGIQHDLDDQGIAKTAREEKTRKRDATLAAKKAAEDAQMAKMYREVVLKEKPAEAGFVPLGALGGISPAKTEAAKEEVGSFGD